MDIHPAADPEGRILHDMHLERVDAFAGKAGEGRQVGRAQTRGIGGNIGAAPWLNPPR